MSPVLLRGHLEVTNPSDTFIDMTVSDEAGINSVEESIFIRISVLCLKLVYIILLLHAL
mgnify:CR=1 FL=1